MERKIGEIFEHDGEWYQCIIGNGCKNCPFNERKCYTIVDNGDPVGECYADRRKDNKDVIFKKLEKVGEPYMNDEKIVQKYKIYYDPLIAKDEVVERYVPGLVDIVIKQNKEDMEEKKLNLKPFDLEAAKAGKPVCTRDGRKARIICFDRDWDMRIVALVTDPLGESVHYYLSNGKVDFDKQNDEDLMMLPEKKEGWVNVYKDGDNNYRSTIYINEKVALSRKGSACITTIKIEWEE